MRVLVVTNMYPRESFSLHSGIFVKSQIDTVEKLFPHIRHEVFVIRGRENRLNYLRAIVDLRRRLDKHSYDIVHAHYGYSCLVAGLARPRVPVVATFHGSDLNQPLQYPVSKLAAVFADALIVVNQSLAAKLPQQKVEVIPQGVDTQHFRPIPQVKARRELGLAPNVRYLMFPAPPWRKVKNYPLFRSVLQEVRAGWPGPVEEFVLQDLSPAEVTLAMNACDVLVLTSKSEGSPQVIKEALCCNLPIVSVDVGDVKQMIAGANLCCVRRRDADELAASVLKVLRRGGRSNGRAHIEQRGVDLESTARRVVALYEEVLS